MKKQCNKCNTKFPIHNFPPSASPFAVDKLSDWCADCIEEFFDLTNKNHINRILQYLNIAYYPLEMDKFMAKEDTAIKGLLTYLRAYSDNKMPVQDWHKMEERYKQTAKDGNLPNHLDQELSEIFLKELKLEWGDNYSATDLLRLNKLFNASLLEYSLESSIDKDKIKKIVQLSLLIDKTLQQGEVNKDMLSQYANLAKTTSDFKKTSGDTIDSLSALVEFIERSGYKPRFYDGLPRDEYDLILQDYKDYITRLINNEGSLLEVIEQRKENAENFDEEGV